MSMSHSIGYSELSVVEREGYSPEQEQGVHRDPDACLENSVVECEPYSICAKCVHSKSAHVGKGKAAWQYK